LLSKDHTARFYVDPLTSSKQQLKVLIIYIWYSPPKKFTIGAIKANMAGFYYAGDFAQFHNIGNFAEYTSPSKHGINRFS